MKFYNSKNDQSINLIRLHFAEKDSLGAAVNGARFERSDWYGN